MTQQPSPDSAMPDRAPSHDLAIRCNTVAMPLLVILTIPILLALMAFTRPAPPEHRWAAAAAALGVDPIDISMGELTYRSTCALCHGEQAEGKPRLGKPLRNSAYIQGRSDLELFSLISRGRMPSDPENTTGAVMPARGNRGLSDETLYTVIAYLRAIQDPTQPTVSIEDWIIETTETSGGEQVAGLVGSTAGVGHDLFVASCSSCHGASGQGMEGLGKPLTTSEFVSSKTDDELIAFIKSGRPIWDSANTTGVDMPPKGGNPAITDEQLANIVKYIRSIHK